MDDQILALYARGMSTRDIVATFKELYDADVSPSLISRVTDSVLGLDAVVPLTNFIAYGFQKFRFHCVYSTMTEYMYSIHY